MRFFGQTIASPEPGAVDFKPIWLLQVEISQPLPNIPSVNSDTGQKYERAMSLVRLHTQPIGLVELQPPADGLSAAEYATEIWRTLGTEIIEHMRQDGLPPVTELPDSGLPTSEMPNCVEERRQILSRAPFMSIVIATRDRADRLDVCLQSLLSVDYPNYEIIVVDNASQSQATADLIQGAYADKSYVRYIREDRPGLSWARNRGIVEARGEIIAFTDDDVVVDRYWLAGLAQGFAATDDVACVTGLILPLELETQSQVWFEQFGGFSKGFRRRIFDMDEHRPDEPLFPYAAGKLGSGNNMAFRPSALRALGGFDPALGAGALVGGEDLDMMFRLIRRGFRLVYEPGAIVHHLHRRDYATLRRQLSDGGVAGWLTKALLEDPRLIFDLTRKLPGGLVYLLSSQSAKNAKKQVNYPQELTKIERRGMLYAPIAYLRSRRHAQRITKEFGHIEVGPQHVGACHNKAR